ncbi:MAG: FAD-dependent oxidoreductase [Planctomycetes bacterium]|nr:FAD-dependent oxidoreductase [Planctomycetota bacterium]
MKLAILGGGVSGLALGHYLRDDPRFDISIFEASPTPGGLCKSRTVDGFVYDEAGGHILFSKDEDVMATQRAMCVHRGGDVKAERRTWIRYEDRFVQYPFENGLGDLPPQARYECLKGYLHSATDREMNPREAPRGFESWVRWRFGEGIAKHFMLPYNQKIWCYDLEHVLSSDWVAGRVPDAPVDDVLKAACQVPTVGYAHQAIFYYPLEGGFQTMTDGFALEVGERLRTATPVERVEIDDRGALVNGERFDLVVNTIPLPELAKRVPALSDEGRRAIENLRWLGLSSMLIAMHRPTIEPNSWIYLPFESQGPVNRVTYFSNYSPRNAPAGKTSYLAEVTFPKEERPRDDQAFRDEVVAGLENAGLLRPEEVAFTDVTTQKYAYVVFDHDFHTKLETGVKALEDLGILTFGRFGRFEYLNSDMCIARARDMARALVERVSA